MRRYIYTVLLAAIAILLVSCESTTGEPTPLPEHYPLVDPLFREYYQQLGGLTVMGPALSNSFDYEGLECQFTSAALMVYDPQAAERERFRLAPIGVHMNIVEPPVPQPERQDIKYVDGHVIYEKFVPLYEQLGGGLVTGKPLTELHHNPTKRRYEQYFENIGFFIMEKDSAGAVQLLSYGAWFCGLDCQKMPAGGDGEVVLSNHTAPEFVEAVRRLGQTFTGFAISDDYLTPDGYREQVFENVVLISDPNQPAGVVLRSIPERLGYLPEAPVESREIAGMIFYPTQADGKGYHIPVMFTEYIAQHGGQEIFGQPIEQHRLIRDNVYRQCFQTVCLEEHLDDSAYMPVRPSPLGYAYIQMTVEPVYQSTFSQVREPVQGLPLSTPVSEEPITSYMPASVPPDQVSQADNAPQISIRVWETFSMVSPDGYQEIGVSVYENNTPVKGIEPDLYVSMPDQTTRTYYMYPTGDDGQSRLVLEPIDTLSGTIIPYEVCVFLIGGQKLCVEDSFVIW